VEGDAALGRDLLLGGDFMTCGIPYKVYRTVPDIISGGFGGAGTAPRIPDRPGKNADMPYFMNVFTAPENGAEVVNANCLMCHGGMADGKLTIGLGNATADLTRGAGGGVTGVALTDDLLDLLGLDEAERSQLKKIGGRGAALNPLTRMRTIGMSPAELFAVILMVHHDRETLAWSDTPLTPLIAYDGMGGTIDDPRLTSDPPPWWRVHKKNALFYNGMARGDHRGTMALATSVCVDDVERARVVDEQFKHIQAFVRSVRAPAWTRAVDAALVEKGRTFFTRDCKGCHGTYAEREEDDT
jgi:cytochrome c5